MRRSTCFSRFLPLGFCFLVLFHGCLAQLVPCQQQESPRLRSECQIETLTAREPNRRQVSEAGFSEFWDSGENDGLDCAGVQVVRHTINPKGLLLPYYPSTHELVYVVRGRGIQGTVLSGCPETFETSFPAGGGGRDEQFFDKHQRVYRYKEGDVLALPAGAVHWTYNDGDTPIVTINLRDTSNVANQLDRNFRKFFLAGNPQSQQLDLGGGRPWTTPPQQHGKPYPGQQPSQRPGQQPSQRPGQGTGTSQRPTGPYRQPWEIDPSQRPSEGTGPSQHPGQETDPYEQPWGTGPTQRPWGTSPSQRPSKGTGPYEQPWGTGPSQRPWGSGPSEGTSQRPWGTSQRPGQETGSSQRPGQGTGPYEQPWKTDPSQRPSQGTKPYEQPWETSPSQRPWGSDPSQRPGQGTSPSQRPDQGTDPSQYPWGTSQSPGKGTSQRPWGTSQRPGQGSKPYEQPWETSPSQRPWGTDPSQRPGEGTSPYEQPWETSPSQHPGGISPSQRPWGSSQYPGQGTGPSQRPGQETGPSEYPWGTSQRPSEGTSQRPWGTSQRPGQGTGSSQRPGQGTGPYQQPSKTSPSQQPGSSGSSQRPGQGTGPYEQPWEKSPSQYPWGTDPSQRPGEGTGPYEQPWETRPSQRPWGTEPSQTPGAGTSPSQRPSEGTRPAQETGSSKQPWGPSERPSEGTRPSERPWGTSKRPDQGTGSSERPWGTGTTEQPWGPSEQPWGPSQHPGQGTGPSKRPWGSEPSQRPTGKQEDPCEVCRRIRGELGLGDPCASYNEIGIQQEQEGFNMFSGFDNEILQEAFNVEYDTIWKLQGQNDDRGLIVHAENFQVNIPGEHEQEQERFSHQETRGSGRNNSIGQTICATQLSANIASPALADVYNPRGGRISSINSHKLPILNLLQLSAERGVLYKNAVLAPHYNLNAHSIIYVTSGNSRLQIVRNDGSSVFDDVVREGQLIVVPQDFAVVKKAGEQGCEWVAFKTNNNAMTTQLAGRFSFIRSLPQDVVANSYDISREQAKNLKYNRQEGVVLSPLRTSRSTMKKKAKNALLNAFFG